MTVFSDVINRKADLAIGFFKFLITIACLSLLAIFFNEWTIHTVLSNAFDPGLWICNAVMIVLYLTAGGFFMVWFYALYKRLYVESPQVLRVPPVWTVLGFSFPVANLFLPYVLVVKTWRRLNELNREGSDENENINVSIAAEPPRYFKVWWASHLICFFAVPFAYTAVLTGLQNQSSEIAQITLSAFAYSMVCVSAAYAIRLVRELKSFS